MLDAIVDLIAPPRCVACGGPGRDLCSACRADLPWLGECCPRCALPRPCGPPCPATRAAFAAAWAPLAFEGPARALVHALKFRGRTAAARLMAAQIAANGPPLEGVGALVPVPARPGSRRARGFDHAALLAAALGRRTSLPVLGALSAQARARQVGRSRAQRRAGPRVRWRRHVHGAIALVDDVHTTGATLDAAARAARAAGADRVVAITYARTLG